MLKRKVYGKVQRRLYFLESVKGLFETTMPKYIFFDGQDYAKVVRATNELDTTLYTLSNHLPQVPSVNDLLKSTGTEHKFT